MVDRGVVQRALSSPEWRSAADALLQASGIAVSVVDFTNEQVLFGGAHCSFCSYHADMTSAGTAACFDAEVTPPDAATRIICRAGTITHVAPIAVDGVIVAHVVASGFVASTRERRRLFEYLLARGVSQDSARIAVRTVPVITRREAEAYVQIAVAVAEASIAASAEREMAETRERDARIIERIGSRLAFEDVTDGTMLAGILGESIAKAAATAGAVLIPVDDELEVAAIGGQWRGAPGVRVPVHNTAAGRAAATRRAIVVPAERGGETTLAAPIILSNRMLGVLELRLPGSLDSLDAERQRRLDGFLRLLATILERRRSKQEADRQVAAYIELDQYSASLARMADADRIDAFALDILGKSFTADAVGISISSWGRDRARLNVTGRLTTAEIDHALDASIGRNLASDPLKDGLTVTALGEVVESAEMRQDLRVLATPMEAGDLIVGYCFLVGVGGHRFDSQDHALLEMLARHTAAAYERAALLARLRDDYTQAITALAVSLDATERVDTGHSRRVMDYALMIAEEIGVSLDEYEHVRFAGVLHDVGKAGLSKELLLKPSKLSPEEFAEMQRHSELGAGVVEQIEFLKSLTPIILHHHERWDGGGYPEGLAGAEIPLLARVLAVADSFEAMTSDRPFRSAMSFSEARAELERGSGVQYDPRMVTALLVALDREALAGRTGLLAPKEAQGRPDLPA